MVLSDEEKERLLCIVEVVLNFVLWFQIDHKLEHNSSEQCRSWMRDQACGGYLQQLASIIAIISDTKAIEHCGLVVSPVQVNSILSRACEGEISTEDDFSDVLGQLACEY